MSAKRIIPCLDVKDGRVVKGVKFKSLRDAGDPAELALRYEDEGADEIVFLDITASSDGRGLMREVVRRTAENLFVPLTVGGGLRTLDDISRTLDSGADRVALNTSAVSSPTFIQEAVDMFGSQCIVLAVDAKKKGDSWVVHTHGGRKRTVIDACEWVSTGEKMGAGEILLTSMDADGTKRGYDIPLIKAVSSRLKIPVIASGGCGRMEHIYDALMAGADAALAASIFHYETIRIQDLKEYLDSKGIEVRKKG
jgi:cyclase